MRKQLEAAWSSPNTGLGLRLLLGAGAALIGLALAGGIARSISSAEAARVNGSAQIGAEAVSATVIQPMDSPLTAADTPSNALATKVSVWALRPHPALIPAELPVDRHQIALPLRRPASDQAPLAVTASTIPAGALVYGDSLAPVYTEACDAQAADQVNGIGFACVQAQALSRIGAYAGTVDVTANQNDKDGFELTVNVTDFWLWPVLAAAAGLLVAFLIQGPIPTAFLWNRWADLKVKAATLTTELNNALGNAQTIYVSTAAKDAEIQPWWRRAFFNDASEQSKAIKAALDDIEKQMAEAGDSGKGPSVMAQTLTKLKASLGEFNTISPEPKLKKAIEEAYSSSTPPKQLEIHDVSKTAAGWTELAAVPARWLKMDIEIKAAFAEGQAIKNIRRSEDQTLWAWAWANLKLAQDDLYAATSGAELDALRNRRELDKAVQTVRLLKLKTEKWPAGDASLDLFGPASKGWIEKDFSVPSVAEAESHGEGMDGQMVRPILQFLAFAMPIIQITVVLLSFVGAVWFGMNQLYVNKPFGTINDYVAMFGLGGAGPAAVAALVALLARLAPSRPLVAEKK